MKRTHSNHTEQTVAEYGSRACKNRRYDENTHHSKGEEDSPAIRLAKLFGMQQYSHGLTPVEHAKRVFFSNCIAATIAKLLRMESKFENLGKDVKFLIDTKVIRITRYDFSNIIFRMSGEDCLTETSLAILNNICATVSGKLLQSQTIPTIGAGEYAHGVLEAELGRISGVDDTIRDASSTLMTMR